MVCFVRLWDGRDYEHVAFGGALDPSMIGTAGAALWSEAFFSNVSSHLHSRR